MNRRPPAVSKWTEERVEALMKLWGTGISCWQIAHMLGGGLTKNAVIGKSNRLGLPRRKHVAYRQRSLMGIRKVTRRGADHKPLLTKKRRIALGMPLTNPPALKSERIVPAPVPVLAEPLMVGLLDLASGMCRWPIGDPRLPSFGFCGHPVMDGKPYCAAHHAVAYQPRRPKERRPGDNKTWASRGY